MWSSCLFVNSNNDLSLPSLFSSSLLWRVSNFLDFFFRCRSEVVRKLFSDFNFINQNPDGTVNARMLFINLRGFFGIQYDVVGRLNNGNVDIISMTEQVQPDRNGPFQAFKPDVYAKFKDVRAAVLETLKTVK
jgi:hypothetical protein